jgi:hypothetical protein
MGRLDVQGRLNGDTLKARMGIEIGKLNIQIWMC